MLAFGHVPCVREYTVLILDYLVSAICVLSQKIEIIQQRVNISIQLEPNKLVLVEYL